MKKENMKTQVEIFICNHKRDDEECCGALGAKDLTDTLKKWAKSNHKDDIKVYRSGCLSKCSEGIAAVCYPNKDFYLKVKNKDTDIEELKIELESLIKK